MKTQVNTCERSKKKKSIGTIMKLRMSEIYYFVVLFPKLVARRHKIVSH